MKHNPAMTVRSKAPAKLATGPIRPVILWALIGCVLLGIGAYSVLSWLFSPYFVPAPVGNTPIPPGQLIEIHIFEGTVFVAGILALVTKVFVPWFRTGSITWDGMIILALLCMWWEDPLDDYVNYTFMYNAYAFNYSSWASFIPGFGYPNHTHYPEPLLLLSGLYIFFFYLPMIFGCWVMRRLAVWKPGTGPVGLIIGAFLALLVADFFVEVACLRTGAVAYAGTVHALTFWAGKPYQFPFYEMVLMGGFYTVLAALRYFRDDKGFSFAEAGVDKLRLSPPVKKIVSFLALAGFVQAWYLLMYFAPIDIISTSTDQFPPYPSYMRAGICGEGTAYACPDKLYVPIPRVGGAIYVGPDDSRLPAENRKSEDGPPYGFFSD